MNKTKIEWCDYTWNPVTGCLHGCSYCYARRFAERGLGEYGKHPKGERFKPRFHPERLDEPAKVKKPSRIFVCSMADLFGDWMDSPEREMWIDDVISTTRKANWHTYIWLTKNPRMLADCWWREQDWVGVTVTCQQDLAQAVDGLAAIRPVNGKPIGKRFISFEPLLTHIEIPDGTEFIDWIIIGAMTGRRGCEPKPSYVQGLLGWADGHCVPVFLKDNLNWPEKRQEFPDTGGVVR